ncbi:MAG: N-acetyltransferase family protein [Acidimicrobiales bacterium]
MIRQATVDDAHEVLSLIRELARFERMEDEVSCTVDDLCRELFGTDPVARVSLVAEGAAVAGMALWFPTFSTFLGRRGIWLEDLFVREAWRGHGYGRALVEHLRTLVDGRVEWAVLDWNRRAIDFYESLGARPVEGWTTYRWLPPGS